MSFAESLLADGAGADEPAPAGLPGSSGVIARTLPAEYLVEPKVQDCSRHQHYATGGFGYSEPYSSFVTPCIGCAVGKLEEKRKTLHRYIWECNEDLRRAKERYAKKDDPSAPYTPEQIADIEFTMQALEVSIEQHEKELEEMRGR